MGVLSLGMGQAITDWRLRILVPPATSPEKLFPWIKDKNSCASLRCLAKKGRKGCTGHRPLVLDLLWELPAHSASNNEHA